MSLLSRSIWLLFIGTVFCSKIKIELLPSPQSLCGEGPHWDESTQNLYYIDIDGPNETILRYDFNENKTYAATVDGVPLMTFILPVDGKNDEFLVGTKHSGKIVRWDGKSTKGKLVRTVFKVEPDITSNRFNDAKSDPIGRFFGGTQRLAECDGSSNPPNASLYSYDQKSGVKQLIKDVAISNGLTWIHENNSTYKFYYVDSCTRDLLEFDYNIDSGKLSNECIVFTVKKNGTVPDYIFDGMTSDVYGNLFIAIYGGGKVMKVNPRTGEALAEYVIPSVNQITSVTFGGPKLDILFVTTASRGNQPNEAGHLYQITGLNTHGTPGVRVKV